MNVANFMMCGEKEIIEVGMIGVENANDARFVGAQFYERCELKVSSRSF